MPNLREVEPGVYRGGQPTAAGWTWLAAHGVRVSVKLNYEPEGAPPGIRVVVASMPPETLRDMEARPKDATVKLALDTMLAGGGIYVHCDHGQDRTGLLVGLYRVAHDHWTRSAAWREMLRDGYHVELLGLDDVWEDSR